MNITKCWPPETNSAGLAVDGHVLDARAGRGDLLDEPAPEAAASLREDEAGLPWLPVDERGGRVAHVDAVGRAEVDEPEADEAFRLLATDPPSEVETLRLDLGQLVDPHDRGAADAEDLEEGAPGARATSASTPARTASKHGQRDRERPQARAGTGCAARKRAERRGLGPGDLVAERVEAALELRHG